MSNDQHYSRPIASAYNLGEYAVDKHRFTKKKVLLIGEAAILSTKNGRMCLLNSLSLLIRICQNIVISLPPGSSELLNLCKEVINTIKHEQVIVFADEPCNVKEYDAILCIGSTACPELPWTVINSNGWFTE